MRIYVRPEHHFSDGLRTLSDKENEELYTPQHALAMQTLNVFFADPIEVSESGKFEAVDNTFLSKYFSKKMILPWYDSQIPLILGMAARLECHGAAKSSNPEQLEELTKDFRYETGTLSFFEKNIQNLRDESPLRAHRSNQSRNASPYVGMTHGLMPGRSQGLKGTLYITEKGSRIDLEEMAETLALPTCKVSDGELSKHWGESDYV